MLNLITALVASAAITTAQPSGVYPSLGSLELTYTGENLEYSIDGSDFQDYTQPIYIFDNSIVTVRNSETNETENYTYKLRANVSTSVPRGKYYDTQIVKIRDIPNGAKVYYTLDGSKPTRNSNLVSEQGIIISASCFLRLLAIKDGWSDSYQTFSYLIADSKEKSIEADYKIKFCYNTLTSEEQKVYAELLECIKTHSKGIYIDTQLSYADIDRIAIAIASDNPYLFWYEGYVSCTSGNTGKRVSPSYNLTAEEVEYYSARLDAEILKLQTLSSWAKTDLDTIKSLSIPIMYSRYKNTGSIHERTPVGTLLENNSLCAGRSQTLAWVLQRCGYQTVYRYGYTTSDDYHMWLSIKVGERWYNIDPSYNSDANFMKSDSELVAVREITDYFNIKCV